MLIVRRVLIIAWVVGLCARVEAQTPAQGTPLALTLDEALQYAVDHYPTIRAALEQVNASGFGVDAARAAYLPRLDAVWQVNRATANNIFGQTLPQAVIPSISGPVLASPSTQSVWGSALGTLFSWEPLDLGLRVAGVSEAEAAVAHARAELGVTRLTVQSTVGIAFLSVVSAQQALAAADADVERRDALARAVRALADNQLRPGAEASRSDAELAAARTRAIQARQALVVAQAVFGRVLGIADRSVSVSPARLMDGPPPGMAQGTAVPNHPVTQSRQASVDLARAREAVLAKSNRPRLLLQSSVFARGSGANLDGTFDGRGEGLGLERTNWAAGFQLVFPNVFEFSSLRARRAAAGAVTRAEMARHDEAVLTVTTEQRTADALVEAARAIAENTPIQLAAAQQTEAQARARYEAGLASIVEVAEAQSLLATAEYQNVVARVDLWRALLAQAVARGTIAPFVDLVRTMGVP
jgi:outer membrane protein TolC